MSVIAGKSEDIGKVFDDLCLSRKVMKRAEGTQTPTQREVPVAGEVPDECVSSLIDMLTPNLRRHYSRKIISRSSPADENSESSPLLAEIEEISVNRARSKTRKVVVHESSPIEMREVFEELCLSRKKTSFTRISDLSSSELQPLEQYGEVPDENVSSMIEMLRPSIRQLPKKNGVSTRRENPEKIIESKETKIRAYQSEPTVGPLPNPDLSTTLSEVSLGSIFTTPSNLTDTIDENLIKTLLSSQQQIDQQIDKGLVETGSNTESSSRHSRRKSKKRRKKSKVKLIKDSGTDTIYQTEDSTNQTEDMSSNETEKILKDRIKSTTNIVEIKEECNLNIEVEKRPSKEVQVGNNITILRNRTDWTDTPFLPQDSSETVEESTSNVDSEPTRGCPGTLQYKIQFNSGDKNSSNTKTEIKRIKAILHTGKRPVRKKECEDNQEKDFKCTNFFSKPITNACTVTSPFGIACLNNKNQDRMFPSHSSLSTPGSSAGTSLTSIRTYSCSSSYEEQKLGNCCCNTLLTDTTTAPGEPKVFWAITKINVYPDDSRTYEVMPLTGKKPAELPEKSDSVFVLIPPKPGQFVPSNFD